MSHIYILDASSILSVQQTLSSFSDSEEAVLYYTTPDIKAELKDTFSRFRIESMISSRELIVQSCSSESMNRIKFVSNNIIGNSTRLSEPDQSILALTLDLKKTISDKPVILLTDDYEIQNTASQLKLAYQSIRSKGIRKKVRWKNRCRACGTTSIDPKERQCPECGSSIKFLEKKYRRR